MMMVHVYVVDLNHGCKERMDCWNMQYMLNQIGPWQVAIVSDVRNDIPKKVREIGWRVSK